MAEGSRYKLVIAYDGTDYGGWQIQPGTCSIEQVLRKTFKRSFNRDLWLLGASRTDAGVHAFGQVVLCKTPLALDPKKLRFGWNNVLPSSIFIRSCQVAPEEFYPHANVIEKTYWYSFFTERPVPFDARYGWYCSRRVDLAILQEVLQGFVGTHDFRAFCKAEDAGEDTVRTIHSITLEQCAGTMYRIQVCGPRFMRHMIRRLVGAAMHAAIGSVSTRRVREVFSSCDANNTLPKAPAQGLMLRSIKYAGEGEL